MPKFTYDETSTKELKASLTRVITFLERIKVSDVAYSEKKKMKTFLSDKRLSRDTYVHLYAIPNFFFHVATAYDIFRNLGVPLKKEDYLGR